MTTPSRFQHALGRLRKLVEQRFPGDKLPSEKDLASTLGVSRVTAREALARLWHEGVITRRWGSGTFVANKRVQKNAAKYSNFYIDSSSVGSLPARIRQAGHSVDLHGFAVSDSPTSVWVRDEPGFDIPLWRVERCLHIDGQPAVLMVDHFPQTVAGSPVNPEELEDIENDFQTFLRSHGKRVVKQEARLSAKTLAAEEAEALQLEPASPALVAQQRTIIEDGEVIACSDLIYRSDGLGQILVRTIDG
ncbi:GntR family transcriptional regulator [Brevibacterium linens]|uniref:GntR family transcriptional regulator n=1 Tax=Brevibacterium linens TaxID=1703 RepID=UPI003BF53A2F